jgi:hypothetical protein
MQSVAGLGRRSFGETARRDVWWLSPLAVLVGLSAFIVYSTWAAFQGTHYTFGPYLSPFYSPEVFGDSPHAWFGPKPEWWPLWLPFSPALLILWAPGGFRLTCYYYRGAYYKAFWADPPSCTVGEPRKSYLGERSFPLVLQNFHRYLLLASFLFLIVLWYDALKGFWFADGGGGTRFGVGFGSVLMLVNVILLSGYTFGCHATRHVLGGMVDRLSGSPLRKALYDGSSACTRGHMNWAWASLFSVALTDLYIRLCASGVLTDVRLI